VAAAVADLRVHGGPAAGGGGVGGGSAEEQGEGAVVLVVARRTFERLLGPLGQCMAELRRRLRANAYSYQQRGGGGAAAARRRRRGGRRGGGGSDGGPDYEKLFRHYDRDNSGALGWPEFRALVRKDGRVPERLVSERQLRLLFDMLDLDQSGALEL
jgi:hypothetical protein